MNKKIISSGLLAVLIILGSFGAVGTNTKLEIDDDCGCYKNTQNNYYLGELEEDQLPPGITFSGKSPSQLDWRNKDGHDWTTSIRNQGDCGSCYAFGSLAAVESCIKIENNDPNLNIDLSEQFMVSCGKDWYSGGMLGCDGAQSTATHAFLDERGAIPEDCFPYASGSGNIPPCSDKCSSWDEKVIDIDSARVSSSQNSIKNALNQYGPVSASLEVFEDFEDYNGGVYQHQTGSSGGWHRICIVGYNDNHNPGYWICKNSWGTGWGENGWFKIAYGECSIENAVYYVDPEVGMEKIYCYGQDHYDTAGDVKNFDASGHSTGTGSKYAIRMSEGSDSATVWYKFDLSGNEVEEGLKVGLEFLDWGTLGNGPKLYIYNFKDNQYDLIADGMGNQEKLEWKWRTTSNSNDYVDSDGTVDIKIHAEWFADTVLDEICIKYKLTSSPEPDLKCEGSISAIKIKPGTTVKGSFKVKNVGDSGSELDWEIVDYPHWGSSWSFTPDNGENLGSGLSVTVKVSFRVPDQTDSSFDGEIKVVNKEDHSDYEKISVSASTPLSRLSFFNILEILQLKFSFLFNFLG